MSASASGSGAGDAAIAAACSLANTAASCYTASWYLVWDQVRTWLLVQLPVVAAAVGYEWLEVSSYRYIEHLRKLCDSPLVNVVVRLVESTDIAAGPSLALAVLLMLAVAEWSRTT